MTVPATPLHPSEAVFIAQIIVLVGIGRLLGELMQRIGQPAIMGQLLAGVLLGPSIAGAIVADWQQTLFPSMPEQKAMLDALSQLGVILILLLTGMEMDLSLVRNSRRASLSISLTGILVPFGLGVLLGYQIPDTLLPDPQRRLVTALFFGIALSISSVKIVALIVRELGFLRRHVGQVIIASAIIDDTLGWVLMSVIFGIAQSGDLHLPTVAKGVLGTAAFLFISFTVGRRAVFRLIRWSNDRFKSEFAVVSMIVVITGVMALITDAIGVHSVLGAFIAGILIGESPILTRHIEEQLRGLITALFMPVFFGMAGLSADLRVLADPSMLMLTLGLVAIASVGKFCGALAGGRWGGLTLRESVAVGCGMNARGSTEIIIATFGLAMGALDRRLFTAIVAMAVVTTLTMPPLLRAALRRVPFRPDEKKRLERETSESNAFLSRIERLLLAVDESASGQLASHLAGLLAGVRGMPTTALQLSPEAHSQRTAEVLTDAAQRDIDVDLRVADRRDDEEAIADEAGKGYGLLFIGREPAAKAREFDPQITRSAKSFGGTVAIVVSRGAHRKAALAAPLRILVPIKGTAVSTQGAELAIALAQGGEGQVAAMYVDSRGDTQPREGRRQREAREQVAAAALQEIVSLGAHYDVEVSGIARRRTGTSDAVFNEIRRGGFNLLVLGVSTRPGENLYFGDFAADQLERCPCSILFVASVAPPVNTENPDEQLKPR